MSTNNWVILGHTEHISLTGIEEERKTIGKYSETGPPASSYSSVSLI